MMPGPRPRKGPQARGQGVAAAKQMGLFMEFGPEDMLLGMDEAEDDEDLEAELLALTGEAQTTGKKPAPKGQAPLPMAHIEKLAADCMRDVEEEEEEEGLEEDAELLTELQEVLGVDEETEPLDGDEVADPGGSEEENGLEDTEPPVQTAVLTASAPAAQAGASQGLHALLEERIHNYREAAASAKEAGEAAKARRCERGLKTLESQLASVRRGRKINEDEIPPPVALGKRPLAPQEPANRSPETDPPAPPALESARFRLRPRPAGPAVIPTERVQSGCPQCQAGWRARPCPRAHEDWEEIRCCPGGPGEGAARGSECHAPGT